MKKLSKVQREVLEALAEDPENRWIRTDYYLTPSICSARDKASGLRPKVHSNTLAALRRRGYVEYFKKGKPPWWARDFRITEAGIEAVSDSL